MLEIGEGASIDDAFIDKTRIRMIDMSEGQARDAQSLVQERGRFREGQFHDLDRSGILCGKFPETRLHGLARSAPRSVKADRNESILLTSDDAFVVFERLDLRHRLRSSLGSIEVRDESSFRGDPRGPVPVPHVDKVPVDVFITTLTFSLFLLPPCFFSGWIRNDV